VDLFAPRSKNDWKSWHSLWKALPCLVLFLIFDSQAATENDTACRQRTSFGTISDCERSGRSGYHCSYVFPVDGEQYKGDSASDSYRLLGNTVVVYYDPQKLTTTSLEDFSVTSRKDQKLAYLFLLISAALVAFVLYSKAKAYEDSKRRAL